MIWKHLRHRSLGGARLMAVALSLACGGASHDGAPGALQRVVEARFPIDLAYRPCLPAPPSAEGLTPPSCGAPPSPAERARILERAGRSASPAMSVAATVALAPATDRLRDLVDTLRARTTDPTDRDLLLGAVEHALARRTDDPALLVDAFEHNAGALSRQPASEIGLFNQALIATDLGLCRVARESWRSFLDQDPSSPWAEEARERLGLLPCLDGSPADADRQTADVLFDQALDERLPQWAAARDAAAATDAAAEIARRGEELDAVAGDAVVRRLAAEIDSLDDPVHRQAIAAYARGHTAFKAGDLATAGEELARASPILRRRHSVLAPWCDVWLAGIDITEAGYGEARRRLAPHLGSADASDSPSLAGRLHWTAGLAALREGRLETAFDHFASAEQTFRHGGYSAALASVRILEAMTSRNLGFFRPSWSSWTRGMRALQAPHPPVMVHNGLLEGATAAQLMGAEATAAALLREAAMVARDNEDHISEVEVLLWQGRRLRERGEHGPATEAFEAALAAARTIPREYAYARERFDSMARLGLWTDPRSTDADERELRARTEALAGSSRTLYLRALRSKAAIERRRGDAPGALATLRTALAVLRTQQQSLGSEPLKLSFLESRQSIFDDAIVLALAQEGPLEALRLLEAARQLDAGAPPAEELLPDLRLAASDDIASQPAEEPVVVVYGLMGDAFAWWRVDGKAVRAGTGDTSSLSPLAQAVVDAAPRGRVSDEDLKALYRILLEEPLQGIRLERPLILVPDGSLQQIPYAALRHPSTGHRLIEDRALSFRTDLGEALRAPAAEATPRGRWRVLTVGDPAFDASRLPWLPRLPGAHDEARRIAELYGSRAMSLIDEAATAERLREALPGNQVLHLAGHATAGSGPGQDAFVLAASTATASSGLVVADDLLGDATSLRLVVLSACSTLGRRPTRSGGLMGIARTFVSHGVAATVGTLWPIADRPQVELMIAFHQGLQQGLTASEALRRAQLEQLRREPACCDWAAVQVLGDLAAETAIISHEP
jgi:hypothetical protein